MVFLSFNYLLNGALASFVNSLIFLIFNLLLFNLIWCICSFNPVYTVLFLMLAFTNLSTIMLILGIKFVAFMILLIYVGAISVLLMFVLMMLNLDLLLSQTKHALLTPSYVFIILFLMEFCFFLLFRDKAVLNLVFIYFNWAKLFYIQTELVALGVFMFNYNSVSVILISLILLIALVGSISLVSDRKPLKKQLLSIQLKNNQFTIIVTK